MIELRPTLPEDLPSLSRLFEQGFGHGLSPDTWRWKYQALPGESRSLVAVTPAGEVVAHAGALALPARWPGVGGVARTGLIWQLVDFVGSPRRRGLRPPMVDLGRALLDDLPRPADAPWIFGFPSRRHFGLGVRTFGYRPLGEIGRLSGAIPDLGSGPTPLGETGLTPGDHWLPWMEGVPALPRSWGVIRDPAFFNWRYHARPERYYRFYRLPGRAEGPADGEGLAVFAFGGEEALAAELWLPPGREPADALAPVAEDLRASGLTRWTFWRPPESPSALDSVSDLVPDGDVFVGFRRRGGAPEVLEEMEEFRYLMGDYDLA